MQMQSLQRLLGILKQDGKLAKAEVLSNLCDVVWEYLPKSIRCAVACANHASVFFHRMKECQAALVKWKPKETWFQAAARQHLQDRYDQMWHDYWAEEDYQTWLREDGRV